ncbi:hypothetical protein N7512_001827 [Penicillium capsulatum]|nr:hypothetical protein N7512_001827 [Penicillium capsulatum]
MSALPIIPKQNSSESVPERGDFRPARRSWIRIGLRATHLSRLATAPGEKPPGAGWRIAMSPRAGIDPLQTTEVTKRVVFVGYTPPHQGPRQRRALEGSRAGRPPGRRRTRGGTVQSTAGPWARAHPVGADMPAAVARALARSRGFSNKKKQQFTKYANPRKKSLRGGPVFNSFPASHFWALSCMHGVSDSNRGRRVCVEREADTPRRGRPGGCGARGALGRGRSAAQGGRPGSPGRGAGPAAPRHGRGGRPVGGAAMGAWAGGRGRRVGEGVTAGRWRAARGRQFAAGHGGGTGGRGQACRGLGGGWGHPGEGGTRRVRARRFASSQRAVGGGHTGGGALGAGHAHGGGCWEGGPRGRRRGPGDGRHVSDSPVQGARWAHPVPLSEIYILAHTYSPVDTPPIVRPTRVPEIYLDPSRSAHALSGQPRGGGAAPAPARPAMPRGGPFGGGYTDGGA